MKPKHKKTLAISISVVTVAAIFIWYFFPVLAGKWFIYHNSELLHELNVQPSIIDALPASPPDEWENISIDTLSLSLPMRRFNKIRVFRPTGISFISDQGVIFLPSLVPTVEVLKTFEENGSKYPLIPYEDFLDELNTIPDDVSFFKSRSESKTAFNNLTLKRMVIPASGFHDFLAVNSSNLKAICILSDKRKNGFCAIIILYNLTESMTVDMSLMGYKTSDMLKSDILNILGSIKMPEQPLNAEKVKADIESISRNYK